MIRAMRTTISLDDELAAQVRREAAAQGRSVGAFIASVLSDALKRPEPPFRLVTVPGSRPRPGIDLDRPRAIDTDDDEWAFTRVGR